MKVSDEQFASEGLWIVTPHIVYGTESVDSGRLCQCTWSPNKLWRSSSIHNLWVSGFEYCYSRSFVESGFTYLFSYMYSHGGTWSNRPYVALALFSLLATCVVFWSHRRRDIGYVGYTAVIFLPESMYITLDSSACTSSPSLKRHKCLWRFCKATGLHELSSFLLSQ